jgi:hypothetical protein
MLCSKGVTIHGIDMDLSFDSDAIVLKMMCSPLMSKVTCNMSYDKIQINNIHHSTTSPIHGMRLMRFSFFCILCLSESILV